MPKTTKKPTKRAAKRPLIAVKRGDRFSSRSTAGGHRRYIVIVGVSPGRTGQGDQPIVSWFETARSGRRLRPARERIDGSLVQRKPEGRTFLTFDSKRGQWIMPSGYSEVARA